MSVSERLAQAVSDGALIADPAQTIAALALDDLSRALAEKPGLFRRRKAPKGLYIWGDVGRGKTLLMDLFFEEAQVQPKRRVHFNAFMVDVHARIHAARQQGADDPIQPVGKALAQDATLLCLDEFQVTDVADAMILGRLFEKLFQEDVTVVATSNTAPYRLYEGGLNRQLFLPFIAELEQRLDMVTLNGPTDYRLDHIAGRPVYLTPLSPDSDAALDAAFKRLTGQAQGAPTALTVLGRTLPVPQAARGVARFAFSDLCEKPLGAADYLAVAQNFHAVLIDHIPVLTERNAARRFVLLVDTLYDMGVKLICSAAAAPQALYPSGDGADAFRRTASRLAEMQSNAYLQRGHGLEARHA
jgi:cell division protein ZapE